MKKFFLCLILLISISNIFCANKPLKVSVKITGKSGAYYHAKIYIINQSKSNITFWMWTCDISDSFVFNTTAASFNVVKICDGNHLFPYDLSPNKMYVFEIDIVIDRKKILNFTNLRLALIYNRDRIHKELIWCDKPIKYNW